MLPAIAVRREMRGERAPQASQIVTIVRRRLMGIGLGWADEAWSEESAMMADAMTWGLRTFAVLLGALAALAIVVLLMGPTALTSAAATRTITVSGQAAMAVRPDKVDVSATVSTAAKTTAEALDANNQRVTAVLAGLKADGIAAKDIRTSGFTIAPQHPQNNDLVTTGYIVTNSIAVTLPATEYSGKIVDRLVRLGATAIDNVNFYAQNNAALEDAVREKAAVNARVRAEHIAKALGARLVRVATVAGENEPGAYGLLGANRSGYAGMPMWRPENADALPPVLNLVTPQGQIMATTLSVTFEIE